MSAVLTEIDSFTRPTVTHRIFITPQGVICCTCEDFMYRVFGQPVWRMCKHIEKWANARVGSTNSREAPKDRAKTNTKQLPEITQAEQLVLETSLAILKQYGLIEKDLDASWLIEALAP